MGAATRYLSQRYTAPWGQVKAGLTDIGTEELAHIEIVSAILYQLTKGLTVEQIKEGGMEAYFVDHTPVSIRRRHLGCRFLLQPCNQRGTSSAI